MCSTGRFGEISEAENIQVPHSRSLPSTRPIPLSQKIKRIDSGELGSPKSEDLSAAETYRQFKRTAEAAAPDSDSEESTRSDKPSESISQFLHRAQVEGNKPDKMSKLRLRKSSTFPLAGDEAVRVRAAVEARQQSAQGGYGCGVAPTIHPHSVTEDNCRKSKCPPVATAVALPHTKAVPPHVAVREVGDFRLPSRRSSAAIDRMRMGP
mmetsp:Transcript_21588/g.40641  ORF Transcript_21588/g.40641 Transcript_21588/m.40641 type:complete len:209 (+) Transcript_21588:72-698(+)